MTDPSTLTLDRRRGSKIRHKAAPGADPSALAELPAYVRRVFVFLMRTPGEAALSNHEIAQGTHLAAGSVTNAVASLRKAGAIVSETATADRTGSESSS